MVSVEPPLIVGTGIGAHKAVALVGIVDIAEAIAVRASREGVARLHILVGVAAIDTGTDVEGAQRVEGVA